MTNEDIKRFLDRGDYIKIARLAGYENTKNGRIYVYSVLSGRSSKTSIMAKNVLKYAKEIAIENQSQGKQPNKK